ncbi:LysR family transcriptional regulator [Ferrimonas aestuarii]|uniref:LysR family transcriptional regulator n=1 Tax=Ferrimonas aestuarii TaxID=2569539 RepID=A0A4U1BS77_9GAMM|nr:LysR family transcriptional regulator [Ferrimonas aestuarii]TKB58483.1 LysR family transcriptional regulator [Ferrimonas aestuarii]
MKLQIEAIRAFVITAEAGSFTAAGKRLKKTQAAISQQIQNLEIDLGFELFCRSGKLPKLTPRGQRLLKEAKLMLAQVEQFSHQAQTLDNQPEPKLRIGIDPLVFKPEMVGIFSEFSSHFPEVELTIAQQASPSLFALLEAGQIDGMLGINSGNNSAQMSSLDVFEVDCRWLASPQLLQHLPKPINYTSLNHSRIVMPSNLPSGSIESLTQHLAVWQVEDLNTLLQFARGGIGVCCLPEFVVQYDIEKGRLVPIQFEFDRVSHFSWRASMFWQPGYQFHDASSWLFKRITQLSPTSQLAIA